MSLRLSSGSRALGVVSDYATTKLFLHGYIHLYLKLTNNEIIEINPFICSSKF